MTLEEEIIWLHGYLTALTKFIYDIRMGLYTGIDLLDYLRLKREESEIAELISIKMDRILTKQNING